MIRGFWAITVSHWQFGGLNTPETRANSCGPHLTYTVCCQWHSHLPTSQEPRDFYSVRPKDTLVLPAVAEQEFLCGVHYGADKPPIPTAILERLIRICAFRRSSHWHGAHVLHDAKSHSVGTKNRGTSTRNPTEGKNTAPYWTCSMLCFDGWSHRSVTPA